MSTSKTQPSIEACLAEAERISKGDIPPDIENRRRHDRHPVEIAARIVWLGDGRPAREASAATVLDLSLGGARIATRQMLYAGSVGVIEFPAPGGKARMLGLEVVRCQYAGSMRYTSGCRFIALPAAIARRASLNELLAAA